LIVGPEASLSSEARLTHPIGFSDPRLVRKVLEAQAGRLAPVATTNGIVGFGSAAENSSAECTRISFMPRGWWVVSQVGVEHDLFSVNDETVRLPVSDKTHELAAALKKVFGPTTPAAAERFRVIAEEGSKQAHGTMLVVTDCAASEVSRLASTTTLPLTPVELNSEAVQALSRLDGALLFDPDGFCHAAGVVVDGVSVPVDDETSTAARSRGARFNSARRYCELCKSEGRVVLIAVISEDGYFDLFP